MTPSPEQHKAALAKAVYAFKAAWMPSNASRALAIEIAITAYLSALPGQTGETRRLRNAIAIAQRLLSMVEVAPEDEADLATVMAIDAATPAGETS